MIALNVKARCTSLVVVVAVMSLSTVRSASGGTVPAASCNKTDVQNAINAAVDGDVVAVPAGTCTWAERLTWTNKRIHVMGAGIGQTVILGNGLFLIEASANPASFRISNFTFTGPGGQANEAIKITNQNTTSFTKGWRVDHNRFLYSNAGETMAVYGLSWGVIDHNTWDTNGSPALPLYIYGYLNTETGTGNSLYGSTYWNRPMNLGSDEAIYFENNTLNFAAGTGQPFVFDMDFGGAIVVRHNVIHNAYVQTHSARTNGRGGFKYEMYNNVVTDSNSRFALMRSGSGVFFNNQVTGTAISIDIDSQHIPGAAAFSSTPLGLCSATNPYDGHIEATGWPCLDQPGRGGGVTGANEESIPLYSWNNGTLATCATGGACDNTTFIKLNAVAVDQAAYIKSTPHVNGQVDFVNNGSTPKPGYTPLVYPHPTITGGGNTGGSGGSGGSGTPPAPSNLRILSSN